MRTIGEKVIIIEKEDIIKHYDNTPDTLMDTLTISSELPFSFRIKKTRNKETTIYLGNNRQDTTIYCDNRKVYGNERIILNKNKESIDWVVDYARLRKSDSRIDARRKKYLNIGLIRGKAEKLTKNKKGAKSKAEALYEYVLNIPHVPEEKIDEEEFYNPDFIIKNNIAVKCADKSQLFEDLCRLAGVPARKVGGIVETNLGIILESYLDIEQRKKLLEENNIGLQTKNSKKLLDDICKAKGIAKKEFRKLMGISKDEFFQILNSPLEHHAWNIYHDGEGWRPVDVTLGCFGKSFVNRAYFLSTDIFIVRPNRAKGYQVIY